MVLAIPKKIQNHAICYLGFWKFVQHFIKVNNNELEDETIDGNELL